MKRALLLSLLALLISSAVGFAVIFQDVYDWNDAIEEAYFYSVYNAEALLYSEFGELLEGQDEIITGFIAESGFTADNEPIVAPLLLPYSIGTPQYAQTASRKWQGNPRDQVIRTRDLGQMILTYAVQAKQLERLYQTGIDQNRNTRLNALVMGLVASKAMEHAHSQMREPVDDLYFPSNTERSIRYQISDQVIMLWALSELAGLTDGHAFYRGSISRIESELWADDLFEAIQAYSIQQPDWIDIGPDERALLIQALSAYGSIVSSSTHLEAAVDLIHTHSRELMRQLNQRQDPVTTLAKAVRALVNATSMSGDESFRDAAVDLWSTMNDKWNDRLCIFDLSAGTGEPNYEYSATHIGDIVGAFSALIYGAGMDELKAQFGGFFEKTVKTSRLMNSELDSSGGSFDNDSVPRPGNAGGRFGTAPVFSTKVLFDPSATDPNEGEWFVTNSSFETGPATYLAMQLMWIGQRERQPYVGPPRFGIPTSSDAQFIGLQKQIEQLRSNQAEDADVQGIRTLLESVERSLHDLQSQVNDQSVDSTLNEIGRDVAALSARLDNIEGRLAMVEQVESTLSSTPSADAVSSNNVSPTDSPISIDETVAVLIIFLLLLVGFVTYQWVVQRAAKTD